MIIEHNDVRFYCDKRLYNDIAIFVKDAVESNMDTLILCNSAEGFGKSLLSRQIAFIIGYILHKNYGIDVAPSIKNVHYSLNNYIRSSLGGVKYQVNILDEARSILNRSSSMTKESKRFTNYLSECRKLNQFHILNIPSYCDIHKYIYFWRCRYFIRVMSRLDENFNRIRGTYRVYPIDDRLNYCYNENKHRYPTFNPKRYGGYIGDFKPVEPFKDIKKLEENQKQIMEDKYINQEIDPIKQLVRKLYDDGKPAVQIAEIVGKNKATVYRWLNEIKSNAET